LGIRGGGNPKGQSLAEGVVYATGGGGQGVGDGIMAMLTGGCSSCSSTSRDWLLGDVNGSINLL
jgi:hypothetical protein